MAARQFLKESPVQDWLDVLPSRAPNRLVRPRSDTSPVVSLMHADVLEWLEDPGGSATPPSIPDLRLRRN